MRSWFTHKQNNVLVYVRMYAVTERGVVGRQVDCSILWLQRLQSSHTLLVDHCNLVQTVYKSRLRIFYRLWF